MLSQKERNMLHNVALVGFITWKWGYPAARCSSSLILYKVATPLKNPWHLEYHADPWNPWKFLEFQLGFLEILEKSLNRVATVMEKSWNFWNFEIFWNFWKSQVMEFCREDFVATLLNFENDPWNPGIVCDTIPHRCCQVSTSLKRIKAYRP